MAEAAPAEGLIASMKRAGASAIELARTRIELVSVEIEEQIEYAAKLLLWGAAAIYFASLALLLVALTIVIIFWDTHRVLAASLVTVAFALGAIGAALAVCSRLRHRPHFLSATTGELKKDAAALEGKPP